MYPFGNLFNRNRPSARQRSMRTRARAFEPLEARQLLSASAASGAGPGANSIAFSLAPTAVQSGLTSLATTDGLTAPTATTPVALGNVGGVETYSVTIDSTGTVSRLTVDPAGSPVTAPTVSTTTFANLPAAASAEITAIATAKSFTAPTSTTTVNVSTTVAGVATYSVDLDGGADPVTTTTSAAGGPDGLPIGFAPGTVQVDAAGDPVGNQQLPFSVLSTTIQTALNAGAPTGATALTSTSNVDVRTADGITTYSAKFSTDGTDTTVIVNAAGAAVTPASHTTADFSAIPTAAQTELQALATADGYTGTIATTQSVDVYTEVGGTTTLYAVTLSTGSDTTTTSTDMYFPLNRLTLVADTSGNPTVLPSDDATGGDGGGTGQGGPPQGGPGPVVGNGDAGQDGGASGSSGGSSGSGTTTPTGTPTPTPTPTTTSAAPAGQPTFGAAGPYAAALSAETPATPTLGPALGLFASVATDTTVAADLNTLKADLATLRSTVKALSKANAATYRVDEKAISAAVGALNGSLATDRKALRSDTAKYTSTLRADQAAVRKDKSNATALSAAESTLASDEATAFTALAADLASLKALIAADAGVTAAQSKLTTDLPTVAADQAAVQSDYTTLQRDIGSAIGGAST